MSALLNGKGLWEYSHPGENFDARIGHALALAPQMGATHILFKVAQGPFYYGGQSLTARQRIEAAGLTPFAWMWLQLTDPQAEAQAVARAFAEGYQGFIFNMESHKNPDYSCSGRYAQATQLGQHLQQLGIDPQRLYLCSFPNIYRHRDLPYDQMAAFCRGGAMPMAYGTFFLPDSPTPWETQARRVIDEWMVGHHLTWCANLGYDLPLYPVLGPFHDEEGQVRMGTEEFQIWLDRLSAHQPTFFSVYAARSFNPALAPLVRAFELGEKGPEPGEAYQVVVESPIAGFLRLRALPSTSSDVRERLPHGTVLQSLEGEATTSKVGQPGVWLRVRAPSGNEGYVAAWYLRWPTAPEPDRRKPVDDGPLPFGQSAWLYGIHVTSISDEPSIRDEVRGLFQGTGKRGWILFTEGLGHNPAAWQPNEERKSRYWSWSRGAGYGVIIRLNHGYELQHPDGTLPESALYPAFAQTCARYAELYLKHPEETLPYRWVLVIGNEQNNPREWRGGATAPVEVITPALYAQAFNLAYQAIKSVLGDAAIVVPGAVDPFNYDPRLGKRPLDYFSEMLNGIQQLDGFALHTYTHGHDLSLITKPTKFQDDPLKDHFYDFQAYRPFMERIPAKWRDLPVYITETNAYFKAGEHDLGWYDDNRGWIRAAYEEINRWNWTNFAQQIRALVLYRWAGDWWEMRGKGGLLEDFRQAVARDYRWRA